MSDKRLSQYAADHELSYISAYRAYKNGKIEGAYQDERGNILIHEEQTPPQTQTFAVNANNEVKKIEKIGDLKYGSISSADSNVRKNKSFDNPIVNRFANIDQGIVPHYDSSFQGNKSNINVRDAIILINKAYYNFSVVKNIIELLTEFSSGEIFYKGGNKKSRNFFKAFFKKINLNSFMDYWFREYNRSGNVFTYVYSKKLEKDDITRITSVYGDKDSVINESLVPARLTILNPIDITVGGSSSFLNPVYYKTLNTYEINRLKKPISDTDEEVFKSLSKDVQKSITEKKSVTIPLSTDNLIAVFNGKQPYEGLAIPPFFGVLDDLDFKAAMRKMDVATMRLINQAILLVTTGNEPEKGGINQNNITALTEIFSNESVGRVLVADYTTKATFIVPAIGEILNPKKYEAINNDIYIGLNYILLGDEKFANQASKIQIFIERIRHARRIFIDELLYPLIKTISEELDFKNYPEPYFSDIDIKNDVEWARIYTRLAEIGFLTPSETLEALQNGNTPLKDESIENQTEFKEQKDDGLYEPVAGGPATQKELLDQTNKNAVKMQETDHTHDDKQKTKDRKHAVDNPQAPAPQIVLKAPTKLAQPNGRPAGSTRQKSTNKPRVSGAESLYSGAKVIENILLANKLENKIVESLLQKYELKTLTDQQLTMAKGLAEIIVRNEEPKNWEQSIAEYIEKPVDKNIDRIDQIEDLSIEFSLDQALAAILFASKKEEDDKVPSDI